MRLFWGSTALVLACTACGGTTTPTPEIIQPAVIVATGNLTYDLCLGNDCSDFHFSVTNAGTGCASTTDLAGTVTLTNGAGVTSTANWVLTLGEKATGVFRPGQVKTATRDSGSLRSAAGNGTYNIALTKRTDVKCP